MPPQGFELFAVLRTDQVIRRNRLADRHRGRRRLDDGRSNLAVREPLQGARSPSNRAGRSALGTALFATNATKISVANSIRSDVATSASGLGLRSDTPTPRCRSVESGVRTSRRAGRPALGFRTLTSGVENQSCCRPPGLQSMVGYSRAGQRLRLTQASQDGYGPARADLKPRQHSVERSGLLSQRGSVGHSQFCRIPSSDAFWC